MTGISRSVTALIGSLGAKTLSTLETVGGMLIIFGRCLKSLVPPRFDRDETWRNLYRVGVKSYPIVVVTALFVGAIMVIQSAFYVKKTGATGLIGYGVGFSVFAEIGPILIGLMFSGRVGSLKVPMMAVRRLRPSRTRSASDEARASGSGSSCVRMRTRSASAK